METLKINYLMYGMERTGGTRVLFNFMNELVNLGHEISITTLNVDKWFPLSPDIKIISKKTKFDINYLYGVKLIGRNNKILKNIFILNKLKEITPMTDINVATFSPTAYLASWKSGDGSTPFYHMQHLESIMFNDPLMKKFVVDSYFLPMHKIANSKWLSDQLFKLTGNKYQVVNAAIEHNIFFKRNTSNNNLIKRNDKEIHIVALGKGGWKNARGIFDAVNRVRKDSTAKKIILHYFGHKALSNIPFDGNYNIFHKDITDEDLAILYSNSDIQITFSTAESFPLPPLEAMSCGTAVITTPAGTEDYTVDFENSLIVEPNNIHMLADKIKILIEDEELRIKIGKSGIKTANKFKYSNQVKMLESELKKSLDEKM